MRPSGFCAGLLCSLAMACTSGSRTKAPATKADGGGGTATAASTATAKPGSREGGYIVIASPEPRALNPVTQVAFDVATPLIFDGLVGLDARSELIPMLAERWDRSADGRVLTLRLR